MSVTLEEIKTEHAKVAALIAKFEKEAQSRNLSFPAQAICLAPGEEYAGLILGKDGDRAYHLILLPTEKEDINWSDANKWAAEIGGELPTRREQALLFANLKEHFQSAYYWSGEQHASYSHCAWYQGFNFGSQDTNHKSSELRARAVRRLTIL